jgi:hypothetical protein
MYSLTMAKLDSETVITMHSSRYTNFDASEFVNPPFRFIHLEDSPFGVLKIQARKW